MNLAKNKCNERINRIKKNIDQSPEKMKYIKQELQYIIAYIKKLKKENPDWSIESLNKFLYYNIKEATRRMKSPTRSDMYFYKTLEYLLKNIDFSFNEIENIDREKCINSEKRSYIYNSDIEKNINMIIEEVLTKVLEKSPAEFRKKFVNDSMNDEENKKLREKLKQSLKIFYETYTKEMKKRYSIKLSDCVKLLDEMGFLEKYNNQNNHILDGLNLPMLKYEYKAEKSKCGVTDLANLEFVRRFSLEEIIAMTSFYSNRLVKEVIDYNESLYIAKKIGIVEEIFKEGEYELKVTDEELREIVAQLGFLTELANEITNESVRKITQESTHKINTGNEDNKKNSIVDKNKSRRKAIETYEADYNELYKKLFLSQFDNDFEMDLDIATILEIDRHNLYLAKDFAMESLMVILADKDKNKNMNWGYIPENKNGKNSIQNKEKFVLIGMDMKGYNMPIKLHFEKDRLETFLTNYAKDTKLPVYEGNEDMEIPWNGFMTTQVYMPLTKIQRKQLKETELDKSDYRYYFLEHIKWMMYPNRYPKYLCNHQGNKKAKRYVDIVNGRVASQDEWLEQ